jgi:hypothetical protein
MLDKVEQETLLEETDKIIIIVRISLESIMAAIGNKLICIIKNTITVNK